MLQSAKKNESSKIPNKKYGFITIAAGSGLADIFKGLGVDEVIEGGQNHESSTQDFLNAADKIHAEIIYVLPNNKNIILAAQQAASIIDDKS